MRRAGAAPALGSASVQKTLPKLGRVKPDEEVLSDRIWTIPNALSLLRLALVPVFLYLVVVGEDVLALFVLVFSSLTDFLDGLIARWLKQVTRLGQLLDPAADRLFIFAILIGLSWRDIVPWWLTAAIVARDVALLVMWFVLLRHGFGPHPVHRLGKWATFFLLYALPMIMVGQAFPAIAAFTDPVAWTFALAGTVLYWWGGVLYAVQTVRTIRLPRDAPPL